jgi:dihydrofolate reductase
MSRLIMWNLITLDGFFEGTKPWDLAFHESVWGEELERLSIAQLHGADRLLFGRRTYEGMAAYWQTAEGEVEVAALMNSLPKVVVSRTLKHATWANSRIVSDDVETEIQRLKGEGSGSTLVFGSADLSATLSRHRLFDEYRILVAPVVLGAGQPLFGRGLERVDLKLLGTRTLSSGAVILSYAPAQSRGDRP